MEQRGEKSKRGKWRKKQIGTVAMTDNHGSSDANDIRAELGDASSKESFYREVDRKLNDRSIGRLEAETEVHVDRLIKRERDIDKALLVAATVKTKIPRGTWGRLLNYKLQMIVNSLINRDDLTSATDALSQIYLRYAVSYKLNGVAEKLLENGASPSTRNEDGDLLLKIAMDDRNDEMCSLLLAFMPNDFVRGLFLYDDDREKCELSFHFLLEAKLKKTTLRVLDCMKEHHGGGTRVYYDILESDKMGRPPTNKQFKVEDSSPLHIIAMQADKTIIHHDTVRLLVYRKWNSYAKRIFLWFGLSNYLVTLFTLTYSLIVAVTTPDPTHYDMPLQVSRAVMEVVSAIYIISTILAELRLLWRQGLKEYLKDYFNWIDIPSACLLLIVIPLRFTHSNAQWHVFASGYLLWSIRIFEFAVISRSTSAYARILFRVLTTDFLRFTVLLAYILLIFSGCFFLSLRGDNDIETHNETSTYWKILFVGVRILTESQPTVEYTGENGYRTISTIVLVCFVFACSVVLLNFLIAQVSDTYQKEQHDAQRGLWVNRAWAVLRVDWFTEKVRISNYKKSEVITDFEMTKICESLDDHTRRTERQEDTLMNIKGQRSDLIDMTARRYSNKD